MTVRAAVSTLDATAGYAAGRLDDHEANARTKAKFFASVGTPHANVTMTLGRTPAATPKLNPSLNFNPPA